MIYRRITGRINCKKAVLSMDAIELKEEFLSDRPNAQQARIGLRVDYKYSECPECQKLKYRFDQSDLDDFDHCPFCGEDIQNQSEKTIEDLKAMIGDDCLEGGQTFGKTTQEYYLYWEEK